jgi:hypothetical protein
VEGGRSPPSLSGPLNIFLRLTRRFNSPEMKLIGEKERRKKKESERAKDSTS